MSVLKAWGLGKTIDDGLRSFQLLEQIDLELEAG